jgi:hypothetical protein
MAERRKIVIQTGAGPEEQLPTPHFDAEATLTARPVVPLTDQEAYQMNYAARGAAKPFWRRPALLALIVLAAVSVGVAAGFAIGIYRNRNAAVTPVATAPSSTVQDTGGDEVVKPPAPTPTPEQARAAIPDQPEEPPVVAPKDEPREPTARNERKADEMEARPPVEAKQPAAREKKPVKVDEYTIQEGSEESQAEREQRREERRAERRENRRRGRDEEINVPRRIDRAAREVDRIREIFEGRQP